MLKIAPLYLLFTLILLLGIFARVWEFGELPPGLNQDEASSGVDAFSLYHFGSDRNGVSFPVHFISWGSGQNVLYAYVLIPFIAFGDLTPVTVRLPMLISGILTLPLVYFVAKRTVNEKFALLAMFLLAISPWHIMLSRWLFEGNFLPFVFLLGYACLLKSTVNNNWFILANVFLGLCLYAYGTAYAAIPAFLACTVSILLWSKRVSIRNLIIGLIALVIVSLPIGLFILVNTLQLSSLHLGFLTIPSLPSPLRYETESAISSASPLLTLGQNLLIMLYLLGRQTDGLEWNTLEPYGYLYTLTFPLALIGVVQLLRLRNSANMPERLLLLSWLTASLTIGILQSVNINRISLIFIPLIICVAFPLFWLWERRRLALVLALCVFLVGFAYFTRDYHGDQYRRQAEQAFFAGLLPAVEFARQADDAHNPICVTGSVNVPYIFVLFVEQMNPADYLKDVDYLDPHAPFRQVRALGRYTFGLENCPLDRKTIYVLDGERPPYLDINYTVSSFENYNVYVP